MIDISSGTYLHGEKNVANEMNSTYNTKIPRPSFATHHFYFHGTMQEIIPGVYLGPFTSAHKNCLVEKKLYCLCSSTIRSTFIKPQIMDPAFAYLTLDIADDVTENIIRFFPKVRQFIDEALSNNCKVLVHGNSGNSRSATLVLAYIMEKYGLTCSEALHYVKEKRASVDPNEGFRAQLIEYEPIYKARQPWPMADHQQINDRSENVNSSLKQLITTSSRDLQVQI
ncbi:hypothetical protein JTB14_026091 [Gonioctena quinquepunctata]|nr:hypothetical protein JTB14_026091 [Gonioctena quinquepunctata]